MNSSPTIFGGAVFIIIMEKETHEIAKNIRHEFFVYRNGLLADNLRTSGDTHRLIFGLNLPQIIDITQRFPKNAEVATELWNSTDTRECRLIAPMLYPIKEFSEETACEWISQVENTEIADNLCHKLLRNTPFASSLCKKYVCGTDIQRYIALRLAINLLAIGKEIDTTTMQRFAQEEFAKNNPLTQSAAHRLLDDLTSPE